ncbi:unnamed protein product [Dovyalis caffra]|uniref:Glycosyltransferase n=1 Tax=Dovyalis caffra TaxID=77055 RepID=A0AAV1R3K2_9ROSI|nr:unnamed protein product [Dovyalis caffra]
MTEARNDLKHIAVLAFPFATHGPPLLSLVTRLSATASHAKFSFFSTKESNIKLFSSDLDRLENIKPYNVQDGLPENYIFSGNLDETIDYFLKASPGNFKQAMEVAVKEVGIDFTCIMSDAFLWFAVDMAQGLHVPWVPLWTSGPRSLLLVLEIDLVRQKMGCTINEPKTEQLVDILPGFSELRVADIPKEINSDGEQSEFSAMLQKMGLTLPRAAAVASNSFEELDPDAANLFKSRLPKFLYVGPFALASPDPFTSDPLGCLEWLDKQKQGSVVYISFGSVIMLPHQELAEIAEALEECMLPFLWSFRGNPEEELPKGFLERTKYKGKVVSWTPQVKVLQNKATGVFMTHCGWNSVLESIIGCVPMICRPFFGDQTVNTRNVEAVWGTGIGIEGGRITKEGVTKALKLILSTEEGNKMRKKLEYFQGLALDAVKSNGSSTKNFETLVEYDESKVEKPGRDLILWNSMIDGYVKYGRMKDALRF